MAKSESTKYRLAEAMKTCMKTTSVDDITIRQIVEVCGVTRQTFYRNFLDKYDLINWYFDKLLLKSFEHMGEGTTVYDGLVKKFEYLKEEHLFFAAAFRSDDQNSLKEHDFELILEFYSNLIFQKTGRRPDAETSFFRDVLPWLDLHDCQMAAWRNEISACAACKTTGTWHAGKTCATLH